MSLVASEALYAKLGFPRVSGDEPRVRTPEAGEDMFSPRERG